MKAAFVVQRYGPEVNGGSELYCRQTAARMARHWDLEVLTTCAVDYMTWRDVYPPGESRVDGVPVRRFRVDHPRTVPLFDRLLAAALSERGSPELELRLLREQGPYSSAFLRYVDENAERYDLWVFFTYAYGLTCFGLPRVAERSLLVPTAHDEPLFHLGVYRRIFRLPRGLVFLTEEERDLVLGTLNPPPPHEVAGVGLDVPERVDPRAFAARHRERLGERYLLYLGRVDASKGCGELVESFLRWRRANPGTPLRLALVGKTVMDLPDHQDVVPFGFVTDEEKLEALAGAELLVHPSPYESLSLSLLEAWALGRPALVNGACAVLAGACRRSGGGLAYRGPSEFASQLSRLARDPALRASLGEAGRRHVRERCSWEALERAYVRLAERAIPGVAAGRLPRAAARP